VNGILNQMKRLAGICFQVFHHYFVLWTSPRNTSLLCGTVTDLIRGKAELVAENALLYQQLIAFVTRSLRTDVPSAMTQSVRQENGTSRISSKSGRSMRCTEGSSHYKAIAYYKTERDQTSIGCQTPAQFTQQLLDHLTLDSP